MPLRDHFRPPLSHRSSWEGFHGQWPAVIVQHLRKQLPEGYVAEPRVPLGDVYQVDASGFENGNSTPAWTPPKPTFSAEMPFVIAADYEVLVYDATCGRQLVAAIEIVGPANKDGPEQRSIFVAKCAALLKKGVAVSIVDLVTVSHFNLYADLWSFVGHADSTLGDPPADIYSASIRGTKSGNRKLLQAWSHVLAVGQPLPTLPLWLSPDRVVPLMLEQSYEQACSDLWIA